MKIELNGEYVTREHGHPARVLCDNLKSDNYPLVVAVEETPGRESLRAYSQGGMFRSDHKPHPWDLVPKPRKWHQFVNILAARGDIGVPRDTKRDCDLRLPDGERAGLIRLDYDGKKLIGVTVLEPIDIPIGEGLPAAEGVQ